MIDTHCHLNLDPLNQDISTHINHSIKCGVNQFIVPGVNRESSQKAVEIAQTFPGCFAAVGYHPHEADQLFTGQVDLEEFKTWVKYLATAKKIVALGECGLDYYRLEDNQQKLHTIRAQLKLFKLHLHLAEELNLPVIIHVRDAHSDALKALTGFRGKGVLHCFSGNVDYLQEALKLGLYISFAGNVTFTNASKLGELINQVPLDRLLLETDAPFLNPIRGQWPNTPANITHIYDFIAKVRKISTTKLQSQIISNSCQLFNLPQ